LFHNSHVFSFRFPLFCCLLHLLRRLVLVSREMVDFGRGINNFEYLDLDRFLELDRDRSTLGNNVQTRVTLITCSLIALPCLVLDLMGGSCLFCRIVGLDWIGCATESSDCRLQIITIIIYLCVCMCVCVPMPYSFVWPIHKYNIYSNINEHLQQLNINRSFSCSAPKSDHNNRS